jgi:hypothetical protein
MIRKAFLSALILSLLIPAAVLGADKLIVQNSGGATQFVVTDSGTVGIGAGGPTAAIDIKKTGSNAVIFVNRTDGAKISVNATHTSGNIGTANNLPVKLLVNNKAKMTLRPDKSVVMANGAKLTTGGVWTNASSRDYKENIAGLNAADANEVLKGLNPVVYTYRADKAEKHVGFIAEDVPELVASNDRKSLSPMDIVAVLTKVVQEQKQTVEALEASVSRLEAEVNRLKNK